MPTWYILKMHYYFSCALCCRCQCVLHIFFNNIHLLCIDFTQMPTTNHTIIPPRHHCYSLPDYFLPMQQDQTIHTCHRDIGHQGLHIWHLNKPSSGTRGQRSQPETRCDWWDDSIPKVSRISLEKSPGQYLRLMNYKYPLWVRSI